MQDSFVHLHLHTEYSIVDGLIRLEPLVEAVAEAGMPAIAVTEQYNLFSLVKIYRLAQHYGIKPIIGVEISVIDDASGNNTGNLLLLCQERRGYRNLTKLVTKSYIEGQSRGIPYVGFSWLQQNTEGLIALSCARYGSIGQAIINSNRYLAEKSLTDLMNLFPDRFYLELQRTSRRHEDVYIQSAMELAATFSVPVVATNDVRFLKQEDFEAHEARVCVQQGNVLNDARRIHAYSNQQYLKSSEEMRDLFQDIPEAIENTLLIAQRCNLELSFGEYHLPDFPVPAPYNQDSWLRNEAEKGLCALFESHRIDTGNASLVDKNIYAERLARELEVIVNMGYSGYFLIVADFIRWAKKQDIPVGPGRGSGAGSLVAYALAITELDPIKYDLLFERFLNPERVSLPDFDIDFCMERRDEVIDYVAERFGRDHVSQIITYGSMAAKAVVRDVGRVLGHPYGFVDQIAKLIPFEINITLEKALQQEQSLRKRYEEEEEVKTLIDLARKLEGLTRNAGKHAGGIVIAPSPLTDYMPLYCEQGSNVRSTQFDMGDVEAIGLVKFDFLGLRTLTIIDWAVKDVNRVLVKDETQLIDISSIPLDDEATYRLIRRMDTTAIFQLESDGMKKLIGRLQPDDFNDLIALVALFRPGPLQSGMVDDYIDRKHGRSRVEYPHPALEQVLSPTNGVILYQEQVMKIAQILAGYTLGAADLLRRAMGKKKPEEMAQQRNIFVTGAVANGVKYQVATYIFDLMEKFAGYGFNKSHSAAYALLAYQTAWLKAHHPAAFMAAVLSSDMDNTDKIVTMREELRRMHIDLIPPSVNRSEYKFMVIDEKTVLFGLGAIKGVGSAAIDNILHERTINGEFTDFFDLCKRVDTRKANKRVCEALIRSGAADDLGPGRSTMMANLGKAILFAEQHSTNANSGQDDLFGLEVSSVAERNNRDLSGSASPFVKVEEWNDHERLMAEKETLGFYLEGHPITRYEEELASIVTMRLRDIKSGHVIAAGYIENLRTRSGSRGGRMAEIRLDDRTARAHATLYSEVYQRHRTMLIPDKLIIVKGEAIEDDYYDTGYYMKVDTIITLNKVREECATLRLSLNKTMLEQGILDLVKGVLSPCQNRLRPVIIEYDNGNAKGEIDLGESWKVEISDKLLDDLRALLGKENVRIDYHGVEKYGSSAESVG
ncbi:MAG: DNA polymerase III subunit alpha [Gammaproteobacteria bacterium]